MAAAAGASQITNHDITAVARLPGGPKLLARWAGDLVERIRVSQHHQALDGGQDGGVRRRVGETKLQVRSWRRGAS